MYTNLYVYTASRLFMSGKLYWRIKKDGKWTWKPVPEQHVLNVLSGGYETKVMVEEE